MTPQRIRELIALSPELQALGEEHGQIAEFINAGNYKKVVSKIVTARGIASAYSDGPLAAEALLMKLEGAASAMLASATPEHKVLGSLLNRQLGFLKTEGLDFGDTQLRNMLDVFAQMSIITTNEADNLKALANVPDKVSVQEVLNAKRGAA